MLCFPFIIEISEVVFMGIKMYKEHYIYYIFHILLCDICMYYSIMISFVLYVSLLCLHVGIFNYMNTYNWRVVFGVSSLCLYMRDFLLSCENENACPLNDKGNIIYVHENIIKYLASSSSLCTKLKIETNFFNYLEKNQGLHFLYHLHLALGNCQLLRRGVLCF